MSAVMRSVPLRVKLVAAVLALVAAALVVISASSAFFLRRYLIDQVDSDLRTTSNVVWGYMPTGVPVQISGDYFVVFATAQGVQPAQYAKQLVSASDLPPVPADLAGLESKVGQPYDAKATGSAERWRVQVTSRAGGLLMVGRNLADVDHTVKQLLWIDVLAGGAVLIVLASAGAAVVRASLRPLREIERTAGAIADGDLTQRVPDPEPGVDEPKTEVGRVSRAFNTMLAHIETAFTARAESETAARDAAFAAQASEARARRSEERMRQFVADASHELRTPLTTIRGFAELYRQGAANGSPEDTARLVRRIEDEAARMGLLVEDLLLLARLDRERPVALAPVELRVLATEAVQAAEAVAPDRAVELEVARDAGPLVVLGDDGRLRQVLGNLVSNALIHTPPDAAVTVRLRSDGDQAVIEVVDTGPGLAPEQKDRVFERFYRVDAARTRHDGKTSTGLGLAIVAALVAVHEGTVEVDSEPGQGATFRVRLPLLDVAEDEADTDPHSQAISSSIPGATQSGGEGLQA